MILDPKWLEVPGYVHDERSRCQQDNDFGRYETGLIVDANNVMYRLAFAASKDVSNETEMLAVFIDRVKAVSKEIGADLVVCCMDYGVPLRRSMLGATKKPDKTPEQEKVIELARGALAKLRFPARLKLVGAVTENLNDPHKWLNPRYMEGYEADDLCAAFAFSGLCVHTVLYSTDSDLYQVTDGHGISQMSPATGKFLKSEVPPEKVPGVKALAGDSSDNVVGIKGVGPVTALAVINGAKFLEVDKETALRIRNNITLTALPFPGSFQILDVASLVVAPPMYEEEQAPEEDSEPLPF